MNMKKQMAVLATVALMGLPSAFASGGRGGGNVIDVDSTPYLMDLVSRAVCDWKKGSEFVAELPELRNALNKLARLDWYFAHDLEQEIGTLSFCMTGPLYSVNPYDRDSLVRRPMGELVKQVAYRLYENAYVDTEIFEKMNAENRAMLIVHETMHSYLDMGTFERGLKLRSMVKAIDKVTKGEIVTRAKLHLAMEKNEIIFPTSVEALEGKRDVLMFLKSSLPEQIATIKKTLKPETLAELNPEIIEFLAPWDRKLLKRGGNIRILMDAMLATLQESTPEEIAKIIDLKLYDNLDPVMVALTGFYSLDKDQKSSVMKTKRFDGFVKSGIEHIANIKLTQDDFLIMADEMMKELGVSDSSEGKIPLLGLEPVKELPMGLTWLPELMIVLLENGQIKRLTENDSFYRALGLKNQKDAVQKMTVKIEREKEYAVERLSILSEALVKALLDNLSHRLDVRSFEKLKQEIKMDRF
jgi:hypothetical protein